MPTFLAGLFLGGVSGGATQYFTSDPRLAAAVGVVAAVVTWLGSATLLVVFDSE